jgi:mannose-6-phosphate isomerase-like protein (cupin superfamily)
MIRKHPALGRIEFVLPNEGIGPTVRYDDHPFDKRGMQMTVRNMKAIDHMEFPAGRKTRVMIGQNGSIPGEGFCQGYVEIHPGGSIPLHNHETVESYTILQGTGLMRIEEESMEMKPGDFVFIEKNKHHSLENTGNTELCMMFVYAPQIIVDHWSKEQTGEIEA